MKLTRPDPQVVKPSPNGGKSLLCWLREEKGISQRKMAKILGIARNKVHRTERKPWRKISLGDIESLAPVLDMDPHELFFCFVASQRECFYRTRDSNPFFTFEFPEGIKAYSWIKQNPSCFIGRILFPPKATLRKDLTPKGKLVFYRMEKGNLLMSLAKKECLLKEGECLTLDHPVSYELYNGDAMREAVATIITLPSFLMVENDLAKFIKEDPERGYMGNGRDR